MTDLPAVLLYTAGYYDRPDTAICLETQFYPDTPSPVSYTHLYVAQDVKIMGNQPVKVVMSEDTETLDEVGVVGTAMKKSDLTGAVASVSSKVLEEKPVTNVNHCLLYTS